MRTLPKAPGSYVARLAFWIFGVPPCARLIIRCGLPPLFQGGPGLFIQCDGVAWLSHCSLQKLSHQTCPGSLQPVLAQPGPGPASPGLAWPGPAGTGLPWLGWACKKKSGPFRFLSRTPGRQTNRFRPLDRHMIYREIRQPFSQESYDKLVKADTVTLCPYG